MSEKADRVVCDCSCAATTNNRSTFLRIALNKEEHMKSSSIHTPNVTITHPTQPGPWRRIGIGLLTVTVVLIALVSALPVVLLFSITAVPAWIASMLVLIDVGIVVALIRLAATPGSLIAAGGAWLLVAVLAVFLSQHFAATPPITDAAGNTIPGSIATLETVELNGSRQWITIRGQSTDLPVLLFLAGGPGGSELVMTRRYLGELEKHFIVVNWDQPGVGKSYNAVPINSLTPERYVEDAYALTMHLRERFDQEQIYVLGESWGSILGVWLVQRYPELFHAYISTGQMVAPVENDTIMYELAIELLTQQGRLDEVEQLRRNGPPPYEQNKLVGSFQAFNGVLNDYMHARAHGEGVNHNLALDSLAAPEYGLLDKVNWIRSLLYTFPQVYAQLNDVDFRTQATTIEVPMYFIRGRWDVNSSNALAEEYVALLEAPSKELIWFEDAAHTPLWDSPRRFVDVMVNHVLAQSR
jgi:pimeloyl-ACP methyl ester carboxylesterase